MTNEISLEKILEVLDSADLRGFTGVAADRLLGLFNEQTRELRDSLAKAESDVSQMRETMAAAAEEISEHWDAHCDSEGYGPVNLQRRLEGPYGVNYPGYSLGAFTKLRAELATQTLHLNLLVSEGLQVYESDGKFRLRQVVDACTVGKSYDSAREAIDAALVDGTSECRCKGESCE